MVRQSPWLTGLQSSFIIWTLLRSSFTACNPELAILSNLKLLHCISCSLDWRPFLVPSTISILDSRFSTLDYRILLVQGFGNGTSAKTIAGKLFGRRRVKWWLRCVTCLMLGISLPNCATECAKNPSGTWKIKKKTWAMSFSNLFMVFPASGLFSLLPVVGKVHAHIIAL